MAHVSDLTGRQADGEQLGRLVVEHPEIAEPAILEVFPDEVQQLQSAERLVRLEYYPPGANRPEPLMVPVEQFNALANVGEMSSILVAAITASHAGTRLAGVPVRGRRSWVGRPTNKVDYQSLAQLEPHRGRDHRRRKGTRGRLSGCG
jgi:hypothetical protein